MKKEIVAAYIFLCDNNTEQECFARKLFGGGEKYKNQTKELKKGDKLFLYNRSSAKLFGIFVALSNPQYNFKSEAWGGKFPWQVKIKRLQTFEPITRADIGTLLKFNKSGWPSAKVTAEQLVALESLFDSHDRLPQYVDYHGHQTHDGHQVRSQPEREIDNWLYKNRVVHAYEPSLPFHENKFGDFYLPTIGPKGTYIEYWGLDDEKYKKDKEEKLRLYREYEVDLIEIFPKDNIEKVLKEKLNLK